MLPGEAKNKQLVEQRFRDYRARDDEDQGLSLKLM